MSQAVFITATDTDAGKTWVTSHLIQALLEQRENVKALKPIACGFNANGRNDDVQKLLDTQGLQHASDINCYSFAKPAAPSIAAQAEEKSINVKHLKTWCLNEVNKVDLCLIEGIGGLMVPITPTYLVSDWIGDMPNMPLILIIGAKLGCINHALLTLSHLSSIGREPAWIIINNTNGTQETNNIRTALLPHIAHNINILESGYNQPKALSPLLDWMKEFINKQE